MAPTTLQSQRSGFDTLSFVKYMKNIGSAYRRQAKELISICRTLVQAEEQTPASNAMLTIALGHVDDALKSAADAKTKTSKDTDEKFSKAVEVLEAYEERYHPKGDRYANSVQDRINKAKANDVTSSSRLNWLKEKVQPIKPEQTATVKFLLHNSLLDESPTIVKQVLSKGSDLKEILWNFSRFKDAKKRLTLKRNPHFYKQLPTLPHLYGVKFRTEPIETFQHENISVLTDNPDAVGRVYVDIGQKRRAFGNVWIPSNAIIFRDVCGKLEGESIVGEDIQDTLKLWYFEEPSLSPTSPSPLSPIRDSPSPTVTETPTNFTPGTPIGDWREPILQMLQLPNVNINIRITDKQPGNPSPSHSAPSSPFSPMLLSSSDESISLIELPKPPPPPLTIQIPGSSAAPPSASNYYTPQTRPPSPQRPQVPVLSQRMPEPEPPSTRAPSLPPPQPAHITATPSSTALPEPHPRQLPPVAPPPTGRTALALPTAHPPPRRPQMQEPQGSTTIEAAPCSSRARAAGAPPLTPNVIITSPLQVISTPGHHTEGNEGVIDEKHPVQIPTPQHEDEGAAGLVSEPPPLSLPLQPQIDVPQTQPPKQKRNWFTKIWDYIR